MLPVQILQETKYWENDMPVVHHGVTAYAVSFGVQSRQTH